MDKAFLIILLLCSLGCRGQDSTMFGGNPEHSGFMSESPSTNTGTLAWKFQTGRAIVSSVAVSRDTVYFGSADKNLYAVGLHDGKLRWKYESKGRIQSSPAVSKGLVLFSSYDGQFYAVGAQTGLLRWKFTTSGERRYEATHIHGAEPAAESMPDPFDVFLSSPTVVDGEVYFGSGDGYVYALRIDNGELKWKFRTGDVVHATPAVADGLVYVGSWDSYLYPIDATSGRLTWRFRTGDDPDIHNQVGIQGSATIANGMVYFGCRDSDIYALDARTGEKRWDYSTDKSWVIGTPTVRGNTVFATTSDSGLLLSLDALTGKRLSALALGWPMFSSPVVEGKTLYIGSHKGILMAVDLPAMQVKWAFETDGLQKNRSRLINADGRPNFGAAYRSNFYDDVVIGAAQMMELGAVLSSPVLADGYILFGSMDGNMYALK